MYLKALVKIHCGSYKTLRRAQHPPRSVIIFKIKTVEMISWPDEIPIKVVEIQPFSIYKAALAHFPPVSRQPSIPTALARIWGLQADPQTLAEPNAQIKRPARLQPAQLSEDLPYGHKVSEGLRPLHIYNSLPLELKKSGLETFVFFPRQILRTPRFCLRTKSLRSLCKISSSKSRFFVKFRAKIIG